jgi:hypothetical protein
MNDEFQIDLHKYKESDIKVRNLIIKKIKNIEDDQITIDIISSELNEMFQYINNLENMNSISINNKNKSIDEIAERASIIGEIKANYNKINNFVDNNLRLSSKLVII